MDGYFSRMDGEWTVTLAEWTVNGRLLKPNGRLLKPNGRFTKTRIQGTVKAHSRRIQDTSARIQDTAKAHSAGLHSGEGPLKVHGRNFVQSGRLPIFQLYKHLSNCPYGGRKVLEVPDFYKGMCCHVPHTGSNYMS